MKSTSRLTKGMFTILLGLIVVVFASDTFAQDGTWETKAPMPVARITGAGGVINGKFYVVEGYLAGVGPTTSLHVYDPGTDTWDTTKASALGPPRANAAAAVIGSKLYVAGGCINQYCNSGGTTNILEEYDSVTDTWTFKAPMPTPRNTAAAAAIDGKLYVVGGSPEYTALATLEVYDPATDTWDTTKAPMPTARHEMGAAAIGGKLYVVGGAGSSLFGKLEVYDPATDMWDTTKAPMPTARTDFGVGVINGQLHVVGGNDGVIFGLNTHEVYDPVSDTWTTEAPMPTPRVYLVADVINSKLYVAGGRSVSIEFIDVLEAFTRFAAPQSAGYWKTNAAATTPLLPVMLGNYTVDTFPNAQNVFKTMNCSIKSNNDAVGCLAGQLLAAKLNVENGADPCINSTIESADAFLISVGYIGPSGTYTLTKAERQSAIDLKTLLANYNTGLGCAP